MRVSSKFARSGVTAAVVLAFGFVPALTPTASAQPCELPDNNGTVVLPDPNCPYLSPDAFHMVVDGLPPGTEIIITGIHRDFICKQKGVPQEFCNSPGGIFGPEGEQEFFESTLEMQMEGTGQLAGFQRTLFVPIFCEVNTGPRNEGDPVQTFPNEMVQLQGAIFGDPDFDILEVRAGLNFGLPSPGQTTLTRLGPPGSDFNVDSFFDIFYEIDFVGAPGSILEGLGGTTRANVRMRTGEPAGPGDCELDDSFDTYPDGSTIVPQGGWESWFNDPLVVFGTVTSAVARSLPQSLEIDGTDDIVHQFSGASSGRWELELYQFIPSGFSGQQFVILLNEYDAVGGTANWSTQIMADSTTGLVTDSNGAGSTPIIFDTWIPIVVKIDLDLDRQVASYNGVTIIDDTWSGHVPPAGGLNVAALDLFSQGATRVFYDDVSFCADENTCPADTDGNGAVDFQDILNVLGNWGPYGPCPPFKPADISRNCDVDFADILAILGTWGPCPEEGSGCCLPDGTCQTLPPADCVDSGGIPTGDALCEDIVCEEPTLYGCECCPFSEADCIDPELNCLYRVTATITPCTGCNFAEPGSLICISPCPPFQELCPLFVDVSVFNQDGTICRILAIRESAFCELCPSGATRLLINELP